MSQIGFIGLGIMGEGMAKNLIKAGHSLAVWNRSADKCTAFAAGFPDGTVTCCESAAAVVKSCTLVYVMLSTPEAAKAVYEAADGILAGVSATSKIVDCATLAPEDMIRLSKQVIEKGGRFVEAPVSGSKGPAHNGQLIFLCAGDEALFKEITADLDAMGKASFFFGAPGAGARMKLVVNMTMGSMLCALGEGLALADSASLDPKQLLEVLDLGVMANPMYKLKGPKMLAADFDPNFPLKHAEKDMMLSVALGEQLKLGLPVAKAADAVMKQGCADGDADLDFAALYNATKKQTP